MVFPRFTSSWCFYWERLVLVHLCSFPLNPILFCAVGRVWIGDTLGAFFGWLQGYDGAWWKDRHNLHHVVTNEAGADPDVDLAPLLTYMDSHARKALPGLRKWQHIYFVPLLSFLHVAWRVSSIRFCISRGLWGHLLFLASNYIWMAWLLNGLWYQIAAMVLIKVGLGWGLVLLVFFFFFFGTLIISPPSSRDSLLQYLFFPLIILNLVSLWVRITCLLRNKLLSLRETLLVVG